MNRHPWMQLTSHWVVGKISGWLRRYLLAEVSGTTAALLGITMAVHLEYSLTIAAVIGVWSELIGFYSVIICQEWRAARYNRQALTNITPSYNECNKRIVIFCNFFTPVRKTIGFLYQLLRNLVLEFGAAELLDPMILRPALLMLAMQLISDLSLALIVGKIMADFVFYTVTIGSLELRKKLLMT